MLEGKKEVRYQDQDIRTTAHFSVVCPTQGNGKNFSVQDILIYVFSYLFRR